MIQIQKFAQETDFTHAIHSEQETGTKRVPHGGAPPKIH